MIVLLIVIYIVFISLGLPDSLFGVAWPVVHLDLGVAESFASLYSILVGLSTGGVSFLAGKLIRKYGTGRVTFFSILTTALGLIGISLSPNVVVMMISSVILGYGAGAIDTGLNHFVSLHYKSYHMNWLHCFWGIGVTVSPIIMSYFLASGAGSWRRGYRVIALLQLMIALIVVLTLKRWNAVEEVLPKETDAVEKSGGKSLPELLKIRGVKTSILSLGLYCGMEFLVGTWGGTYLVNVFALAPNAAAKWVSLYFGGIMLGRFISGFISMRASDTMMVRGGIAISFVGMLILLLPLGRMSLLGLLLIGMGFGPIFPSVLHSVPDRFGSAYSADITGYHMGGAYAVGFLVQLLFGYTASGTTFEITPFVLAGLCMLFIIDNEVTLAKIDGK